MNLNLNLNVGYSRSRNSDVGRCVTRAGGSSQFGSVVEEMQGKDARG